MTVGKEVTHPRETPINYPFDAIVVLGVSIQKDPATGKFIFNNLVEYLDPSVKLLGARSRAIAVVQALSEKLAPTVLITGGKQEDLAGNQTTKAQLFSEYMVQKQHVPSEFLVPIGQTGNTLGNISDAADYFSEHPEVLSKRKIAVLTNEFHIPRAMEMFKANPFFKDSGIEINPLSVEDLLSRRSLFHARWVAGLSDNPLMQEVREREEQGLKDFREGRYSPTHY